MPRHADFVPRGVIPAVLLPFDDELAIDERSFRAHLRDVAATAGPRGRHGQRAFDRGRLLQLRRAAPRARRSRPTRSATGCRWSHGVWADGSLEAARIARMAHAGGASALLVFPPAPFTHGPDRRDGGRPFQAHRRGQRPADHRVPISAGDRPRLSARHAAAAGRGDPDACAPSRIGPATCRSTRCRSALLQRAAAARERALHPQRLAAELAGARLQRACCRAAAA